MLVCTCLFAPGGGSLDANADTVDYIVNVAQSLNITLSANNITLDLNPNTKTSDSKDLNIKVSTNNMTGYYLTMSSTGDATDLVRDNTVDGKNAVIPTLSAAAGATASSLTDNTWGYKRGSGNFIPYVSGVKLLENKHATNEDETTLSFASKINYSQASGTYELGLVITGVTNPMMNYIQNLNPAFCTSDPKSVIDVRDMKVYTVQRLRDGQCWMTTDLNLAGGTKLYSDSSDVPAGYPESTGTPYYTLPESDTAGFDDDTKAFVYNSGNETTSQTNCGTSPGCNSYYSWLAATAGSGADMTSDGPDAAYSICPKGWRLPSSGNQNDTSAASATGYKKGDIYRLDTAYGANLESTFTVNSAIFYNNAGPGTTPNFLLAGFYDTNAFNNGGPRGNYWSSSSASSISAYYLYFNSNIVSAGNINSRKRGFSVRCVLDDTRTANDIRYMQDINHDIVANTTNNTTKALIDKRDNQTYMVGKLADGKLWMIQNLGLGRNNANPATTTIELTPNDSNVYQNRTITAYDLVTYGGSGSYCYGDSSGNGDGYNYPCMHSKDVASGNNAVGVWYNYVAATAGTVTGSSTTAEPREDICPKGWKLPAHSDNTGLVSAIGSSPASFSPVYGGYYYDGTIRNATTNGYWWSTTAYDGQTRYYLYYNSGNLNTSNGSIRSLGLYVRCIAR